MKEIKHKATIITARYKSFCPYCDFMVNPGEKCKVYSDEWYHMNCWEKKFSNVVDDRKDKQVKELYNEVLELKDELNALKDVNKHLHKQIGAINAISKC